MEAFCDLRNQLRKRGTVPGSQVQWHVILSALCRIELRVGGKRPIHFKDCVKLRLAAVSIHKMFHITRCELAKVEEVAKVIGLPPNDQFLGESRNLHKADVPHVGVALNLVPPLDSRHWRIEDHRSPYRIWITAYKRISDMPAYVVTDNVHVLQLERLRKLTNILRHISGIVAKRGMIA